MAIISTGCCALAANAIELLAKTGDYTQNAVVSVMAIVATVAKNAGATGETGA
jgi:hypothetical protein